MFSASASLLRERPLWLRQTSAWTARLKELSTIIPPSQARRASR
nr:MAG TPA: hypothetical protein [Caudoviricetes sp.]